MCRLDFYCATASILPSRPFSSEEALSSQVPSLLPTQTWHLKLIVTLRHRRRRKCPDSPAERRARAPDPEVSQVSKAILAQRRHKRIRSILKSPAWRQTVGITVADVILAASANLLRITAASPSLAISITIFNSSGRKVIEGNFESSR